MKKKVSKEAGTKQTTTSIKRSRAVESEHATKQLPSTQRTVGKEKTREKSAISIKRSKIIDLDPAPKELAATAQNKGNETVSLRNETSNISSSDDDPEQQIKVLGQIKIDQTDSSIFKQIKVLPFKHREKATGLRNLIIDPAFLQKHSK